MSAFSESVVYDTKCDHPPTRWCSASLRSDPRPGQIAMRNVERVSALLVRRSHGVTGSILRFALVRFRSSNARVLVHATHVSGCGAVRISVHCAHIHASTSAPALCVCVYVCLWMYCVVVRLLRKTTYFLSMCMNFMSIECMVVKTFVAPWTTHSRVSGIAIGVQVARNTGSLRLHNGRKDK